jgi:transketolase N-terminal domain/subunit
MSLRYVPYEELARLRELDADPVARAEAFADASRLNALYMIARAGSGHIGTSFSCIDILSWLHLEVLGDGDRYLSSMGHDAPALYAVLLGLGRLDFELLHRLRQLRGLPGHPDLQTTPEVITNTGSLGMGISKAKGFALADRASGREGEIFVLTGDGELQEGQFWESLGSAANLGLGRITAIVDHNKIQSDTVGLPGVGPRRPRGEDPLVRLGRGPLRRKRDRRLLPDARRVADGGSDGPRLIVADTLKGAGVSFMEPSGLPVDPAALYGFHSGAPRPVYIRLVTVPWDLGFDFDPEPLAAGRGQLVREGEDGMFVAAGPVMLSQAWAAAEALAADGVDYAIAAVPWLRDIDGDWLAEVGGEAPIVSLDNHYLEGGQGDAVLRALADADSNAPTARFGVTSVPLCGDNEDVLRAHGLDAASIADRVKTELLSRA